MNVYTPEHNFLPSGPDFPNVAVMNKPTYTFDQLLREALRHDPSMWKDDRLNLSAVARYYQKRGEDISQATLHRICSGEQGVGKKVELATARIFGIPRYIIRGEQVSEDMDNLLMQFRLSTILLAKKIESLPPDVYHAIAKQVDVMIEAQNPGSGSKVIPISTGKRKTPSE